MAMEVLVQAWKKIHTFLKWTSHSRCQKYVPECNKKVDYEREPKCCSRSNTRYMYILFVRYQQERLQMLRFDD